MNRYTYLICALILFAVAALIEYGLLHKHPEKHLISDFVEKLHENEVKLHENILETVRLLEEEQFDFAEKLNYKNRTLEDEGMGVLVFRDDSLVYWSDRAIAFVDNLKAFPRAEGMIELPNGYYIYEQEQAGEYHVLGVHLVKYNYQHENNYLENGFFKKYRLPAEYELSYENTQGAYPVFNLEDEYLFSITPKGFYLCTKNQLYFPGVLYLFGLFLLLIYFNREFVASGASFIVRIGTLAFVLFLVYWLHLYFQVPSVFSLMQFFSPSVFALSKWLPSLGDFFLLSVFFLFWMYHFGKHLNVDQMQKDLYIPRKLIGGLLLLFSGSTYLLIQFYIHRLVFNSTISFSLNRIIEISAQSVMAILSAGLLLFAVFFLTVRIVYQLRNDLRLGQIIGLAAVIAFVLGGVQLLTFQLLTWEALALFVVATLLGALFSKNYLHRFTLSYLIVFVSAASVYSLLVFYTSTADRYRNIQKLMAVNLVAERDPAAEVFLSEIQESIRVDSNIPALLIEEEGLAEYLEQTYFRSYFSQYELRIFICTGADSLFIEKEKRMAPCVDFFEEMIAIQGMKIPGTMFYFMDNMNGRISYTGWLNYQHASEAKGVSIFIELNSALLFEGIGFPELLIDKSMVKPSSYKKFSYAKYYAGELTDMKGDYNYNFYAHSYPISDQEFEFHRWDGLEHLIYHTRENNYVIVSRDLFTFIDYLISFPYLFVFYFISTLLLFMVASPSIRNRTVKFDLKFRIQAAIISIVFVSLLLVALATIGYNLREYKEKHQTDLNEKMISIAMEIDLRLNEVDAITPEVVDWLDRELLRMSNTFRTDINIYGTDGSIISSSRPEIFYRGLISEKMNARAFNEIFNNFQVNYFQPEEIGTMSYLSAYRPLINDSGEYLGVINLPYFIKQDRYSQELSTIVVAFINLYVLLFLVSIIVAIFIANQITRPLVLIQENLRKMELGKRNEPIFYKRNDEIGSLVKEYNKKVDEIAISAELLARSERESAWREMARQVAHEIKNPLTPMKLNIQHLQRTRGKGEEYDRFLDRITDTLIEQIDNLSNIATEFSNFAKIPRARNQVFHLAEQIQKVIELYGTHDQVDIEFHPNGLEYIQVQADRDQLSRAIINLVKNAIQAIPEDREGKIDINLSRRDHMAVIALADNGEGVPEDLRDKLFSPSFTTKTSGMGLGLAIVKNIVENFSGYIWFETEPGKGTTFFIEIPIWAE